MLDFSTSLKYYQRKDIQEGLLYNVDHKELGVRYFNGGFGKRPDMLQNKADVLEFAKQKVSSFHISEEHWRNPLALSPSLKKKDLEKMRAGWDLLIDIDCPDWDLSKRIAFVVVKVLKKHGIKSISCKFSGNKGFHIGVPFKAFPKSVQGKPTRLLFPDGVKRIMDYIIYYADKHYSDEILNGLNTKELSKRLGINEEELFHLRCSYCKKLHTPKKTKDKFDFICGKCGKIISKDAYEEYISCTRCKSIVKCSKTNDDTKNCSCNKGTIKKEINLSVVLGLDEILISTRHLYRMAYSLHEKSGLASLPINPFSVLAFEKDQAKPEVLKVKLMFMDDSKTVEGEAADLILKAIDFKPELAVEENEFNYNGNMKNSYNVDNAQEKVPVELFPPCILCILSGIKDGKKRSLFTLVNFLTSLGWEYDDIEKILMEWNKKNEDGLREVNIKGQIRYHKANKKKVLPPNCSNKQYYFDLGVCKPDELCSRVKNPVNYSKKKAYFLNQQNKRKRKNPVEKKSAENKKVKNDLEADKKSKSAKKQEEIKKEE